MAVAILQNVYEECSDDPKRVDGLAPAIVKAVIRYGKQQLQADKDADVFDALNQCKQIIPPQTDMPDAHELTERFNSLFKGIYAATAI